MTALDVTDVNIVPIIPKFISLAILFALYSVCETSSTAHSTSTAAFPKATQLTTVFSKATAQPNTP